MAILIIDFDSTFITVESLDELFKIALKNDPEAQTVVQKIEEITNRGMAGEIGFAESLKSRVNLLRANRTHIEELVNFLKTKITPSFQKHRDFIQKNKDNIYIISGGFKEAIDPVVADFGIESKNVLANQFIFDNQGEIIGFDTKNLLAQDGGKIEAVKSLNLPKNQKVYILGDGFTDYEIKKEGLADRFLAFTENKKREEVVKLADEVVSNFGRVVEVFEGGEKTDIPRLNFK